MNETAVRIHQARAFTDSLFACLHPDALYQRSIPERHRLIFYLGHLEAFDWNLLGRQVLDLAAFHPSFDQLFAFGIDPGEGQLPDEAASEWPREEEVRAYNRRVRETLDARMDSLPETELMVALEHRWMHAETFAYLIHNLGEEWKKGDVPRVGAIPVSHRQEWIAIPAGQATLGRKPGSGFGWDNEFCEQVVEVDSFLIQKYKVSNADYLAFVNEGGAAPHYWTRWGQEWRLRVVFGELPLPLDWPVYVTLEQAAAYAAWKGLRLPTEAEWHRAVYGSPAGVEASNPWGDVPMNAAMGNFGFRRWDPMAVSDGGAGNSAFGLVQPVGNGWEWTSTEFGPLPGFAAFPFYPNYSQPFFDGQHFVLKGASPVTASGLIRRSFRNWFRPNYPYAHATFRCVEAG